MAPPPFSCCVCGTVHEHQSERYRDHVCRACEQRAVCADGKRVLGWDTSPLGGFVASHDRGGDDICDQVTADQRVWIDGEEHRMQVGRFGGTIVVRA